MGYAAIARFMPVTTPEQVDARMWPELADHGAWRKLRDQPVLINHDHGREIGTVEDVFVSDTDDGGRWWQARLELDYIPSWAAARTTAVSVGYSVLRCGELQDGTLRRIYDGFLNEISFLSPTTRPAIPTARVEFISRTPTPPPRPAAHVELERLVGYRIDETNFEDALVASQARPLDAAYAELVARRAYLRPGDRVVRNRDGSETIYAAA